MNATSTLRVRAAGVSFVDGYPRNLVDLQARCAIAGPIPADLERDLDNPADLNATAIVIEGRRLGWIPRDFAAFIAPQLDNGVRWRAEAVFVAVDLDHPGRPGLEVELIREAT